MKKLPTISIKGHNYVLVKDRLLAFQELYPEGSIMTDILVNNEKSVVVRATVRTTQGIAGRSFTGHSEAYREGQMGNVPVEVAETSAVGRALAMLGIGIIEGVASADEIQKANFPKKDFTPGYGVKGNYNPSAMQGKPVSPAQANILSQNGYTLEQIQKMDRLQASNAIDDIKKPKSSAKAKAELDFVENLEEPPLPVIDEYE